MPDSPYPGSPSGQIEDAEQVIAQGPPAPPEPELDTGPVPDTGVNTPSELGSGLPGGVPVSEPPIGGDITAEDLGITKGELQALLDQYKDEGGKIDPVKARYAVKYFELWGVPPPPGYIEDIIASGMNIYEFEDYERSKPSFRRTETYQNEYADAAAAVARLLGLR